MSPLLEKYRDQILQLARNRGAGNVRVFGSYAREEQTRESDVDLLVSMEEGKDLLDLIGFLQDVAELTGKKVDVVSERGLSPYLRERILSEAIAL